MNHIGRLQTLDALRGVAAFMVVLLHASPSGLSSSFVPNGYLAVDFFFMLSGLVMARVYEQRLKEGMTFKSFAIARLIRLYPLFALGLVLDATRRFIIVFQGKDYGYGYSDLIKAFLTEMFFIPSRNGEDSLLFLINPPAWSLTVEVILNIIFAVALLRFSSKTLVFVAVCAFAVMALNAFDAGTYSLGAFTYNAIIGLLRGIFGFAVGIVIGRMEIRSYVRYWWVLGIAAILILALSLPDSFHLNTFIIIFLLPMLVFLASRVEPPEFLSKTFSLLGEASYPMYAVHLSLIYSIDKILVKMHVSGVTKFLLVALIIFIIGVIVSRLYDLPVRRILNKFFSPVRLLSRNKKIIN